MKVWVSRPVQCKVPLFSTQPDIHICIKDVDHNGLHHTYTALGNDIYFTRRDLETPPDLHE